MDKLVDDHSLDPFDFETISKHLETVDCPGCQNQMGAYYNNLKDYDNAILWFRKAVKHNLLIAKHNLACNLYMKGETKEGREWFFKAAEEGYPASLFYMGKIYEQEDDFRAIGYIRRSAKLGFQQAIDLIKDYGLESILE
jgi:TPR repeat protein